MVQPFSGDSSFNTRILKAAFKAWAAGKGHEISFFDSEGLRNVACGNQAVVGIGVCTMFSSSVALHRETAYNPHHKNRYNRKGYSVCEGVMGWNAAWRKEGSSHPFTAKVDLASEWIRELTMGIWMSIHQADSIAYQLLAEGPIPNCSHHEILRAEYRNSLFSILMIQPVATFYDRACHWLPVSPPDRSP